MHRRATYILTHMSTYPTHTVLILSNDADSAATIEALFRERNCAVLTETSAKKAVETARVLSPSLLILDLDLPHVERLLLCRRLRAVMSGAILLLSSSRHQEQICEYYLAGIDEHLATPLSPMVLLVKSMAWLMRNEWMDVPSQPSSAYS